MNSELEQLGLEQAVLDERFEALLAGLDERIEGVAIARMNADDAFDE